MLRVSLPLIRNGSAATMTSTTKFSAMPFQRGDVVLCQLPMPSTGLAQFKLRPAVIVSKDVNNQRLDDIVVAPCTSNISRSREPTQYLIDGAEITTAGVRVASVVRCEALMTI